MFAFKVILCYRAVCATLDKQKQLKAKKFWRQIFDSSSELSRAIKENQKLVIHEQIHREII